MRFFTHISRECEADAKNHGVLSDIQKQAEQIEKHQTVDNLDIHDQFYKKPLGRSFRLVMGKKYDGDDCLLIFWKVFPKGSSDYQRFCESTILFTGKFEQVCDSENLSQVWTEKRAQPDIPQLSELSEDEKTYLYQQSLDQNDEWMILESEEWVKRTEKKSGIFSSYTANLHSLVYDIFERAQDEQVFLNGDLGILYRCLPEEKLLYLIAPVKQSEVPILRDKFKSELAENVTSEFLLKKSNRAYPSFIIYDSELWIKEIQEKDKKANLALSEEETEVLRSREDGYPLFINGRPGSGKSTVLQYLFAEHLYHHLSFKRILGTPLYLTYNKDLLEIAKESVFQILTSNASKFRESRTFSEQEARDIIDAGFVDFREYLSSLLPKHKQYDEDKYIGFPEFRLLFDNKFSKNPIKDIRSVSAELAWHVIRTYIKGTISDEHEYLEPEAFRELPSKPEKSITDSTYDLVYKSIWLNWYKDLCEKERYWDDQDLARSLLMLNSTISDEFQIAKHPVIFCDEAQDFTRNELRLIFRLSLFSRRNLKPDVFQRIPFAFAGDPFQTLNPTGFDWESTRTTFYNTIIAQLDKRQKPTLDFNFRNLNFNYRSTRNIVQLCNFIHLMRGIAFGKKNLQPQKTWFDKAADMPVYFDVDSLVLQSKLREQKEIVIIVPCAEGEEETYVRKDEFLSSIALSEDGKQIVRNVLSPMRAKGQEFSRVVIYKFGEECQKSYHDLLARIDPDRPYVEILQEKIIPLEYFINRLYVAASRAENRLFIADTEEGLKNFWKYFEKYDPDIFVKKYKKDSHSTKTDESFHWTPDDLVKIQPGSQENWEKDHDNPEKLADEFLKSGLRLKDAYKLRLAIQNYTAAGKKDKARLCEGHLFELQGEYGLAGGCFEELGNREKAIQLYWQAEAFDRIIAFGENSIANQAADFMIHFEKKSLTESLALLSAFFEAIKAGLTRPDQVWAKVIGAVIKHILQNNPENSLPIYEWSNLYKTVSELHQQGLFSKSDERMLDTLRVRATIYPEKLEVLQKVGSDPTQIIEYYLQQQQVLLSDSQQDILYQAFQKMGDHDDAEKLLEQYPSIRRYGYFLSLYIREKQLQARIEPFIQKTFNFLTTQELWDISLEFAGRYVLPVDESMAEVIQKHSWAYLLDNAFIKAIAISETLPKADKSTKNDVSKYLSAKLLDRASAFYSTLTVSQSGAALERANMIKDCLEFYENVFDKQTWPASDEERQFAKERWLVCKNRQIELQKDEGSKKRIKRDLSKKQEEWKIKNISKLPEYPVVDLNEKPKPRPTKERKNKLTSTLTPPMETGLLDHPSLPSLIDDIPLYSKTSVQKSSSLNPPTMPATVQLSPMEVLITLNKSVYRCSIARERGKMTIHYGSEQEMLTLIAKDLKISGSDPDFHEKIKTLEQTEDFSGYFIESWNLTCVMRKQNDVVHVDIYQGEQSIDLLTLRIA